MGIGIGQNWRESIYFGIPGTDYSWRCQTLTPDEWDHLIGVVRSPAVECRDGVWKRSTLDCVRDELIIRLFAECGLWIDEVAQIKCEHYHQSTPAEYRLSVFPTSSAKQRVVRVPDSVSALLQPLRFTSMSDLFQIKYNNDDDDWSRQMLQRINDVVIDVMWAAGFRSFRNSVYTLRNTFFDRFISSGGDLDSLLAIIGLDCRDRIQEHLFEIDDAKNTFSEWSGISTRMYPSRPRW